MSVNKIPLSALNTTASTVDDAFAFETPSSCTTNCNYLTSTSTSTASDNLINATNQTNHFVLHFSWFDYGFFLGLLGLSTLIGIYYGFFSKHKQNNTKEYILGGRSLKILPVATSLIATLVSCPFSHCRMCQSGQTQCVINQINYFFSFAFPFLFFFFCVYVFYPLVQPYIRSKSGRITHGNLLEWNTVRGFCDCCRLGKLPKIDTDFNTSNTRFVFFSLSKNFIIVHSWVWH